MYPVEITCCSLDTDWQGPPRRRAGRELVKYETKDYSIRVSVIGVCEFVCFVSNSART